MAEETRQFDPDQMRCDARARAQVLALAAQRDAAELPDHPDLARAAQDLAAAAAEVARRATQAPPHADQPITR